MIKGLKVGDKVRVVEEWEPMSRSYNTNPHAGKVGTFVRYNADNDNTYPYVVHLPGVTEGGGNVWINEIERVYEYGDRVRIVRTYPDDLSHGEDGREAIYVGYHEGSPLPHKVDIVGSFSNWNAFEVELIETKKETSVAKVEIGDTVRVTRDDDEPSNLGRLGEVKKITADNEDYNFLLTGEGFPPYGWWVAEVEKIDSDSGKTDTKENSVTDTFASELETRLTEANNEVVRMREQSERNRRLFEEKETELNNFRKQVAEKAIDIYDDGDGPWCKDGYVEAMEELGLSEFVKVAYTIEVTLTIPAENIPDHFDRNDLTDSEIAGILKEASASDFYYWIDSHDTNDDE